MPFQDGTKAKKTFRKSPTTEARRAPTPFRALAARAQVDGMYMAQDQRERSPATPSSGSQSTMSPPFFPGIP